MCLFARIFYEWETGNLFVEKVSLRFPFLWKQDFYCFSYITHDATKKSSWYYQFQILDVTLFIITWCEILLLCFYFTSHGKSRVEPLPSSVQNEERGRRFARRYFNVYLSGQRFRISLKLSSFSLSSWSIEDGQAFKNAILL